LRNRYRMRNYRCQSLYLIFTLFTLSGWMITVQAQDSPSFVLDVPYVATPEVVITEIFKLAEVNSADILYDLGSGDGRIPISAAKQFGIRAVGVELNPARIREAKENAMAAEVTDKVEFFEEDLFEFDFSEATVVILYLFPEVNLKLRPKILEMKPGTRIISHKYNMGDWEPDQVKTVKAPSGKEHTLYLWHVPDKGLAEH
jgi:tRNA G37 N-methylase Trm5